MSVLFRFHDTRGRLGSIALFEHADKTDRDKSKSGDRGAVYNRKIKNEGEKKVNKIKGFRLSEAVSCASKIDALY